MKSLSTLKSIFSLMIFSSFFMSANAMASSCNKSDIEYYLQKGFTHQQVTMLCSTSSATTQAASGYTTSAVSSANNVQTNRMGEDQVFFSTALDAQNVKFTPQSLSYQAKECVEYGYENNPDLSNEACIQSRITINMAGLKVLKVSTGLFLVQDASMLVAGNIQREYLNINSIRRQERSAIQSLLPTQPSKINIPVKKGIKANEIADRIKQYSK